MRHIFILILSTFPLFVFSQSKSNKKSMALPEDNRTFQGYLGLGLNASQVDGDGVAGYHQAGLSVAPAVAFRIGGRFYMNFEMAYHAVGARWSPNQDFYPNQNYISKLRYVAVPLFLNYHDPDGKVRLGGGIVYGQLFAAKEQINFYDVENPLSTFKRRDLSWMANLQYMFAPKWGLDTRFSYSLLYIRHYDNSIYKGYSVGNPIYGTSQFNNVITVRLFHIF